MNSLTLRSSTGLLFDSPSPFITLIDGGKSLVIQGDSTASSEVLVYLDADHVGVFSDWPKLSGVLLEKNLLKISACGCQFFLAYGFVPAPFTLYENVFSLVIGDSLEIDLDRDHAKYSVDFPYFEHSSKQDRSFDKNVLLRLIGQSTDRVMSSGGDVLVMQSSGKDSTGMLLGLAQCDAKNARCVTYNPNYRESEWEDAKRIASRFGFQHETVDADPEAEFRDFISFCDRSPTITGDTCLIPYIRCLSKHAASSDLVFDGLGNDTYMGYITLSLERRLKAISVARFLPSLWGRFEGANFGAKASYLLKSALMYPSERVFAGSPLSRYVIRDMIPVESRWDTMLPFLYREYRNLPEVDFRAYIRGRLADTACFMAKGRMSASAMSCRLVFPYCDQDLIDYYFNLPAANRYDATGGINKVGLRELISAEVGDFQYLSEKGSMRYDILSFIDANQQGIRDEILGASNLLHNVEKWMKFYMARRHNYVFAFCIQRLFFLSAWLNRRPAATLASFNTSDCETTSANIDFQF